MLVLPRAHHIARCASRTATRLGCRYQATSNAPTRISATALLRQVAGTYERGRPFSTSPPPAGQEEDRATAAASTAATTDSDSVEDAPKQILLYEAGSKVRKETFEQASKPVGCPHHDAGDGVPTAKQECQQPNKNAARCIRMYCMPRSYHMVIHPTIGMPCLISGLLLRFATDYHNMSHPSTAPLRRDDQLIEQHTTGQPAHQAGSTILVPLLCCCANFSLLETRQTQQAARTTFFVLHQSS